MTKIEIPFLRAAAAAVLIAAVSGCSPTPTDAQWTAADATVKENRVVFLRQTFDVHFEPGADRLSPEEQRRLAAFLDQEGIGLYDELTLAVAGDSGGGAGLSARRRAAVAAFLNSRHLKSAPAPGEGAPVDQVTLVVGRYIVVPPNCPDWRKPSDEDPQNTSSSNLGCATTTNLGLMVADPRDLIAGKEQGPSDAENNAWAIQRYRDGYYKVPASAYEKEPGNFAKGTGIPEK